jgi:hypothetical protein
MREACLERARAFLPDVITAQYERLYDKVLRRAEAKRRAPAPDLAPTPEAVLIPSTSMKK